MATPTYVLGMADTAKKILGIDPAKDLSIRKMTCAGEPGASIPSAKQRMEEAWGAKVYDHVGATEIGAWGYECTAQSGGIQAIDRNASRILASAKMLEINTSDLLDLKIFR